MSTDAPKGFAPTDVTAPLAPGASLPADTVAAITATDWTADPMVAALTTAALPIEVPIGGPDGKGHRYADAAARRSNVADEVARTIAATIHGKQDRHVTIGDTEYMVATKGNTADADSVTVRVYLKRA